MTSKVALTVAAGAFSFSTLGADMLALELPGKTWDLQVPRTGDQVTVKSLSKFEELDCAECQRVSAEEWASTRHALAWEENVYQEELTSAERDGAAGIALANRAGHRIPGLNDRVLEFSLQFLSKSGEEIVQEPWFVTREQPLKIREDLWQPLPAGTHQARAGNSHGPKPGSPGPLSRRASWTL